MNQENKLKCQKIVDFYGNYNQKNKAIEELAELIQIIAKINIYDVVDREELNENLRQEIADVYVMLEQIKIIFGLNNSVDEETINHIISFKIERTLFNVENN